jgi:transposase
MKVISTREAAKRLKIHFTTLAHYIANGKLPRPTIIEMGTRTVHTWTEAQVEEARNLLPKIANGRKTRYQKQKSGVTSQKSAVPPAGGPD